MQVYLFRSSSYLEQLPQRAYLRKRFDELRRYDDESAPHNSIIPIVTGFDAEYEIEIVDSRLVIKTNLDAPNGRVFTTTIDKLEKDENSIYSEIIIAGKFVNRKSNKKYHNFKYCYPDPG
ncbi:MAG: hypothetical protein ACUVQ4_08040 [bacterium]